MDDSKSFYRMAEKFLYDYLYTRYEIEKLIQKIRLDVHAQNYNNNDLHSSIPADPVTDLFMRREKIIYQINSRQKIISQVNKFLDTLRISRSYPDSVLIIELLYFCKVKAHDVANKLNISVRTLYQRKKEIIKFFAECLQKS